MPDTPEGKITLALIGQQQGHIIDKLTELTAEIKAMCEEIKLMRPWVQLWRWVAIAFGVAILAAIVAGVLWAIAQSGALIQ